ncbi:MAG: flagellar basal-body rod protein FlgF [Clostridiales bacterium]|nr:flagellar basal-body rod protein FlgF [Clostridiales bacterium]
MLKGLYTAYTGMINEQNRMDIMTNNLANANTVGFKKEGSTSQAFDDVLALKIKDTSESPNCAKKLGSMSMGVKIGENYTDYGQGSFRETGNVFDVAIAGNGFFAIEFTNKAGETSTKYTRDGSFTVNADGYLVTEDGDYVLDEDGERIELDPLKNSMIDSAGNIYQDDSMEAKIGIVDFEDYNYLEKYGENLYQTVEGFTEKEATAQVRSGYLEMANVQVVSEMVNMINITRAYETNQKIIQTYDGSLDIAVNQLGRLS